MKKRTYVQFKKLTGPSALEASDEMDKAFFEYQRSGGKKYKKLFG